MFKTRSLLTLSLLLIVALMLTGLSCARRRCCAVPPVMARWQMPAPLKIGAIFDLTGPTSDVGALYSSGIKGYVDFINANGGH